jgi:hypothetical protein
MTCVSTPLARDNPEAAVKRIESVPDSELSGDCPHKRHLKFVAHALLRAASRLFSTLALDHGYCSGAFADPSKRELGHRPAYLAAPRTRVAGHHTGSRSRISLRNQGIRGANDGDVESSNDSVAFCPENLSNGRNRRRESLDAARKSACATT